MAVDKRRLVLRIVNGPKESSDIGFWNCLPWSHHDRHRDRNMDVLHPQGLHELSLGILHAKIDDGPDAAPLQLLESLRRWLTAAEEVFIHLEKTRNAGHGGGGCAPALQRWLCRGQVAGTTDVAGALGPSLPLLSYPCW